MSKRNWSKYNRELVSRGTLQFLISKEAIKDIQTFRPRSNGGRPKKFPDLLIEILLTVRTCLNESTSVKELLLKF